MGQHKLSDPHRTFDVAALWRQLARGFGFGVVVGTLLIGVGLLRGVVFLLTGGHLSALSSEDVRVAAFYIGGFGIAGGVVGAMLPRLRTVVGLYVAFSLAGMIVMMAIMASTKGGLRAHDRIEWMFFMPLGAVFGCAFAYGWNRRT